MAVNDPLQLGSWTVDVAIAEDHPVMIVVPAYSDGFHVSIIQRQDRVNFVGNTSLGYRHERDTSERVRAYTQECT